MAAALKGTWRLMETEKIHDFTTALGLTEEALQKYKVLDIKGEDGLIMEVMVEGKTVTTIYKLKGITKHTETFTLGDTTKVTGLSGKERNVTASVEGGVVILKSDAPNYVTKVEKCGTHLCMSMTTGTVKAVLKFKTA